MSDRYLPTPLRRDLEKAVRRAREVAEDGARDALRRLGVADGRAPSYLSDADRALRRRLRAHARALGDAFDRTTETQETRHLVEATAYGHWHRMLFARFLAERDLLRHPEHDAPVTLADCRELAADEGLSDEWAVAERYAAAMLPAVFQPDDPVLALALAPEQAQALHRLVTDLDPAVFAADDSLGWTYQFWRAAEKEAVNKSGVKIGADELPAVTQLFTEPYMVRFLLHNTLGAWWAGKRLAADPALAETAADEEALRTACAVPGYGWDMLRFVKEDGRWRPAAGIFPGWPDHPAKITMLDPCCGSGHFLTEALTALAALRRADEHRGADVAVADALRDNLFGLEIDGRCVQIAAFSVALTAWRIGGWQALPVPHIAWVGAPPPLSRREFVELANGDDEIRAGLDALFGAFQEAPILGTLIEPTGGDLADPQRIAGMESVLDGVVERARHAETRPELREGAIAALGMADAAAVLASRHVLIVTNVPFLGKNKQAGNLSKYIERHYEDAKNDLAMAMMRRLIRLVCNGGTIGIVGPQNWLFQTSYKNLRWRILENTTLNLCAILGEHGFHSSAAAGAFTGLFLISNDKPRLDSNFGGIDASSGKDPAAKLKLLLDRHVGVLSQSSQERNPGQRISVNELAETEILSVYANSFQGIKTGDDERLRRFIWEITTPSERWRYIQTTVESPAYYGGMNGVFDFTDNGRRIARLQGLSAHGKRGISISQMRSLPFSLYLGDAFDSNMTAIVPKDQKYLLALAAYLRDKSYHDNVRELDQSIKPTNSAFVQVPFDSDKWQRIAVEQFPEGLPEPYTEGPDQWLFHGHPSQAEIGTSLHIVLARLAGYRWPVETDPNMQVSAEARTWVAKSADLPAGDGDGLLALPSLANERALADRVRSMLAAAFGKAWSDSLERRLVTEADERFDKKPARDGSLEGWLRDRAFRQHCALFHQRPFLWQVWDGLKDGFSAFLHYHRLDQANLRKLTYTLLNDWIARAKAEGNALRAEKARELQQKLEAILEGEAPYDIFVRWKPLARQPLGWDPDLDDGVRMNIRPFMTAGVLRDQPKIKWTKDRGKDVPSAPWYPVFKGERINDHHTTLAEKRAARAEAQARVGSGG